MGRDAINYTLRDLLGGVACLLPFDTEDEVIEQANATELGLAASVWTLDLQRGHRIAQGLDTGVVWVNTWLLRDLRTPFGGMKHSGVGRDGAARPCGSSRRPSPRASSL